MSGGTCDRRESARTKAKVSKTAVGPAVSAWLSDSRWGWRRTEMKMSRFPQRENWGWRGSGMAPSEGGTGRDVLEGKSQRGQTESVWTGT